MFWLELLVALVIALALTAVFAPLTAIGRGGGRPATTALALFGLVFAAAWAGGVWLAAFGPTLLGVAWLPFLVAGLAAALLVAGAAPKPRMSTPRALRDEEEEGTGDAGGALGIFFWLAMGLFVVAIMAAYQFPVALAG